MFALVKHILWRFAARSGGLSDDDSGITLGYNRCIATVSALRLAPSRRAAAERAEEQQR